MEDYRKTKPINISKPDYEEYKITRPIKASLSNKSLAGSLPSIKDALGKTPNITDIARDLESKIGKPGVVDSYEDFTHGVKLVKAYRDKGYSTTHAVLKSVNDLIPDLINSDDSKPILNQILSELPILSVFLKNKHRIDTDTYKHEKDHVSIATGKSNGLYLNAKFYSNHGTPPHLVEGILRKLAGDPHQSLPVKEVIDDTYRLHKYVKVNGKMIKVVTGVTDQIVEPTTGVGLGFNSHTTIFTRKQHNFDSSTNRLSEDFNLITQDETATIASQEGESDTYGRGAWSGGQSGFGAPFITGGLLKTDKPITESDSNLIESYWTRFMSVTEKTGQIGDSPVFSRESAGFNFYNPPNSYDEVQMVKPFKTIKEYSDYQTKLFNGIKNSSEVEAGKYDLNYGMFPMNWHQVFQDFEINTTSNWNVSFREFSPESNNSLFVPDGRPTYGPWHYMPIISYDLMKSDLATTSIEVSQSLSLLIPSTTNETNTLQVTFIDDRYDRIYNWFKKYITAIYGFYDGFAKPYKNCCLCAILDILDWDRTILKREKYSVIPVTFTQNMNGDSSPGDAKSVTIVFSIVGEVHDEIGIKTGYRPDKNKEVPFYEAVSSPSIDSINATRNNLEETIEPTKSSGTNTISTTSTRREKEPSGVEGESMKDTLESGTSSNDLYKLK